MSEPVALLTPDARGRGMYANSISWANVSETSPGAPREPVLDVVCAEATGLRLAVAGSVDAGDSRLTLRVRGRAT